MKKRPLVPTLAATAPAPAPQINVGDIQNLIFAARRALPGLPVADLMNVVASIQRLEALLAASAPSAAPPEAPASA